MRAKNRKTPGQAGRFLFCSCASKDESGDDLSRLAGQYRISASCRCIVHDFQTDALRKAMGEDGWWRKHLRVAGAENDHRRLKCQNRRHVFGGQVGSVAYWPVRHQVVRSDRQTRAEHAVIDLDPLPVRSPQGEGVIRAVMAEMHRCSSAARQHDLTVFLARAVQDSRVSNALDQRGATGIDQRVDHGLTGFTIFGTDLDLDEFVLLQSQIHLGKKGIGNPLAADLEQRLEVMGLAAEKTGLGGSKQNGHAVMTSRQRGSGYHGDPEPPYVPMQRSKSSQRWLKEHFSDPFVKKAQAEGMRSRAAYKLEELLERDRLLKPGMVVVDLGAAPGGWCQQVRRQMGDKGRVLALDILDMPPLAGVEFLHGDFRDEQVLAQFESMLGGQPVDLVLSDMAPNKSGMDAVDQPRMMYLAELALDFADNHLKPGGAFLIKLFHGTGFDDYVKEMRRRYDKVVIRKPEASRKRSPEVYALGQGKRAHIK